LTSFLFPATVGCTIQELALCECVKQAIAAVLLPLRHRGEILKDFLVVFGAERVWALTV